jgi:hypothetical protein
MRRMHVLVIAVAYIFGLGAISLAGEGVGPSSTEVQLPSWWGREPAKPSDVAISIQFSEVKAGTLSYRNVIEIHMDGSVEFGEGFTADSAARAFWEQVGRSLPNKCEAK